MFEATSEIFYILMLILLGKGYTVTRARLRSRSVVKVTVFMSLYCVTYIALFTYERQVKSCYFEHCNYTFSRVTYPLIHHFIVVTWTTAGNNSISIRGKFFMFTNLQLVTDCWFCDFWAGWLLSMDWLSRWSITQKKMVFIYHFSSFHRCGTNRTPFKSGDSWIHYHFLYRSIFRFVSGPIIIIRKIN